MSKRKRKPAAAVQRAPHVMQDAMQTSEPRSPWVKLKRDLEVTQANLHQMVLQRDKWRAEAQQKEATFKHTNAQRELVLREQAVRSAAQLIEALARMVSPQSF